MLSHRHDACHERLPQIQRLPVADVPSSIILAIKRSIQGLRASSRVVIKSEGAEPVAAFPLGLSQKWQPSKYRTGGRF